MEVSRHEGRPLFAAARVKKTIAEYATCMVDEGVLAVGFQDVLVRFWSWLSCVDL
jgi:hypothetical protein